MQGLLVLKRVKYNFNRTTCLICFFSWFGMNNICRDSLVVSALTLCTFHFSKSLFLLGFKLFHSTPKGLNDRFLIDGLGVIIINWIGICIKVNCLYCLSNMKVSVRVNTGCGWKYCAGVQDVILYAKLGQKWRIKFLLPSLRSISTQSPS